MVVNSAKQSDDNIQDKSRVFRTVARHMTSIDNSRYQGHFDQSDENVVVDNIVEISTSVHNDILLADTDNETAVYDETENENKILDDKCPLPEPLLWVLTMNIKGLLENLNLPDIVAYLNQFDIFSIFRDMDAKYRGL